MIFTTIVIGGALYGMYHLGKNHGKQQVTTTTTTTTKDGEVKVVENKVMSETDKKVN